MSDSAAPRRSTGFAVVGAVYAVAGLVAWGVVAALPGRPPLAVTFLADLAATLAVFAATMIAGNASLYDPYWSVAPAVIVAVWTFAGDLTARPAVVLALVLAWAIRLTANWARSWRGLGHEDWRYVRMRSERPGWAPWWLVNLVGIQLVPTLVVFGGLVAVWPVFAFSWWPESSWWPAPSWWPASSPGAARPFGWLDVVAVAVTVTAITVETVADRQMRAFTSDPANRGRIADRGLWRRSRHPNYLGEILFWWGMWLFGLAAAPSWWWTVFGPVVVVLLFMFVSVPMMDRRSLARRPAYAENMRRVPALLPVRGWHRRPRS
jgi:steroid 5-alpha reductase family enzyme